MIFDSAVTHSHQVSIGIVVDDMGIRFIDWVHRRKKIRMVVYIYIKGMPPHPPVHFAFTGTLVELPVGSTLQKKHIRVRIPYTILFKHSGHSEKILLCRVILKKLHTNKKRECE